MYPAAKHAVIVVSGRELVLGTLGLVLWHAAEGGRAWRRARGG
jgi:hypothetical protein